MGVYKTLPASVLHTGCRIIRHLCIPSALQHFTSTFFFFFFLLSCVSSATHDSKKQAHNYYQPSTPTPGPFRWSSILNKFYAFNLSSLGVGLMDRQHGSSCKPVQVKAPKEKSQYERLFCLCIKDSVLFKEKNRCKVIKNIRHFLNHNQSGYKALRRNTISEFITMSNHYLQSFDLLLM